MLPHFQNIKSNHFWDGPICSICKKQGQLYGFGNRNDNDFFAKYLCTENYNKELRKQKLQKIYDNSNI